MTDQPFEWAGRGEDGCDAVCRHLLATRGLWLDAHSGASVARRARAVAGADERVEFVASDARTGRCAFRALPASQALPDAAP